MKSATVVVVAANLVVALVVAVAAAEDALAEDVAASALAAEDVSALAAELLVVTGVKENRRLVARAVMALRVPVRVHPSQNRLVSESGLVAAVPNLTTVSFETAE